MDERIKDLLRNIEKDPDEEGLLANMSYTLLVGRTHYRNRCSLIVRDLADLKAALQKAMEKKDTRDVLRNIVKHTDGQSVALKNYGNHLLEKIAYEEEGEQKYKDDLLALADLYSQGYDLAWEVLFKEAPYYRISLPTYPLSKERYWHE